MVKGIDAGYKLARLDQIPALGFGKVLNYFLPHISLLHNGK